MRILLLLILSFSSVIIEARMYQWVEPDVETTQLSGKPPVWYRSAEGGPRIFVFENGRLIDDTKMEVSDEVRQQLRQEAFILAEEDRQRAREKIAKANEMKQKFAKSDSEDEEVTDENIDEEESLELLTDHLFPKEEEVDGTEDNNQDLEELRKIIADWEASQSEDAKKVLE